MEPGIFSLTLSDLLVEGSKKLFGLGVELATRRLFRAAARCPSCGTREKEEIENRSVKDLKCPSCGHAIEEQFSNATQHTVLHDQALVSAHLENFVWERSNNLLFPNRYVPVIDMLTVNSRSQELVVTYRVTEQTTGNSRHWSSRHVIPKSSDQAYRELKPKMIVRNSDMPRKSSAAVLDIMVHNSYREPLTQPTTCILKFNHEASAWQPTAAACRIGKIP